MYRMQPAFESTESKHSVAAFAILMTIFRTVFSVQQQTEPSYKLLTRSSDGSPLCAVDRSSKNVSVQPSVLTSVPPVVQCAMKCTAEVDCRQFNYFFYGVDEPCQLYSYTNRPLNFSLISGCQHFFRPQGILMQQHFNATPSFGKSWAEFKVGFGDPTGDYWIGNDRLHELTKDGRYKLRVDLQSSYNGQWYWAEYSTFIVDDESTNYTLHIGGYSGTAGDGFNPADNVNGLNGMKFSTWDRDNDLYPYGNCVDTTFSFGGFWMRFCTGALVNGKNGTTNGFCWWWLPTGGLPNGVSRGLTVSRLTLI